MKRAQIGGERGARMAGPTQFLVGMLLVVHGLAHSLPGMWIVDRLADWPVGLHVPGAFLLVAAATLLWAGAMAGLVGAGFGVWGAPLLACRWRLLAAFGAGSSLFLLGFFRPEHALPGGALSVLVLLLVWRWEDRGAAGEPASKGPRSAWLRGASGTLAVFFLLYLAGVILARPWHMRWGSTDAELVMPLPGDEFAEAPLRYVDAVLAPAGLLLFEIPHFIMQRRMLLGIRDLAEGTAVPLGEMDLESFVRHLDRRIPAWIERQGVPGVTILLLQDGVPVWSEAYGWADQEARRPLDKGSVMMTHSISKSVTAWGVMRLVEEGRIGLDDPVRRHLPAWNPSVEGELADRVTIRHLLSHSSGLPIGPLGVHFAPGEKIPPIFETLSRPGVRLVRKPEAAFEYSNLGFGVLEWLVETVTGRGFGEFMEAEVLHPLGMHDSSFDWDDRRHAALPLGYDLRGDPVEPYLNPIRASGGLLSTAEDVGRFVAAGMRPAADGSGDRVLSAESMEEMYDPQVPISGLFAVVSTSYGLGHFLEDLPGDLRAVWHGGQGLGWMTHFHAVPETGDGIVILTNSQRSWPFFALLLKDWAEWRGFGPVGMGRIAAAGTAMNAVVGLILLLAVWRAWRLGGAVMARRRKSEYAFRGRERVRVLELILGLGLLGTLLWAVTREYLYVSSVFPSTAVWLGWSLALLGVVLVLESLAPVIRGRAAGALGCRPTRFAGKGTRVTDPRRSQRGRYGPSRRARTRSGIASARRKWSSP